MASNDREGAGTVGFDIGPIVPGKTPDALLQASVKSLAQMIVLMEEYFALTSCWHEHYPPFKNSRSGLSEESACGSQVGPAV